ncbi:hypothetical protein [Flavobacterium phycosphaerae]|uniref:hypothetical protein n=1 Tax=Flavobacterium phycosphaerae TaxID=2697515 RepID=UPI00138AEA08|nr:hypothetical protein [Flavobacterium phycosphaerae]
MQVLTNGGNTAQASVNINKGIGSLVFYSDLAFDALSNEKINLKIQRNGKDDIEITPGTVSLKEFILACTYGDDAITSSSDFATVCVLELCEHGAINLREKDLIVLTLSQLDDTKTYTFDGIEEPTFSDDVYQYQRKSMASEHENADFQTHGFDTLILTDHVSIEEVNYTFDNGMSCKYTLRELRALSQDNDPIAYVKNDGKVTASFANILQLPLKGVDKVNIKKAQGAIINLFMRHDVDLRNL